MAINSAFTPQGSLTLVGTSVVQCPTKANQGAPGLCSYRIKNKLATDQYIAWAPANADGSAPSITVTAPVDGTPSPGTIGLLSKSVEVFAGLPANAYFKADAIGAFEVMPGEGV